MIMVNQSMSDGHREIPGILFFCSGFHIYVPKNMNLAKLKMPIQNRFSDYCVHANVLELRDVQKHLSVKERYQLSTTKIYEAIPDPQTGVYTRIFDDKGRMVPELSVSDLTSDVWLVDDWETMGIWFRQGFCTLSDEQIESWTVDLLAH